MTRDLLAARAEIWSRSDIQPDGCWIWLAGKNAKGYGCMWWQGREIRAHRLAYQAFVGQLVDGHDVHHICGTRACVNPAHLELLAHGRHTSHHRKGCTDTPVTHCKRGHEFTPDNTRIRSDGKRNCKACERIHDRNRGRRIRVR